MSETYFGLAISCRIIKKIVNARVESLTEAFKAASQDLP